MQTCLYCVQIFNDGRARLGGGGGGGREREEGEGSATSVNATHHIVADTRRTSVVRILIACTVRTR